MQNEWICLRGGKYEAGGRADKFDFVDFVYNFDSFIWREKLNLFTILTHIFGGKIEFIYDFGS